MKNSITALRIYALIRIIIGFFVFYHGWEIFESDKIAEYAKWEAFSQFPQAYWIAYFGKAAEFVAGILLMIGFKTTWASIILLGAMLFIAFYIGHGKVWYEDQHPFMFALFAIQYMFVGAGIWSFDNRKKSES